MSFHVGRLLLWWGALSVFFPSVASAQLQGSTVSAGSALRPQKIALVVGINRSRQSKYWSPLLYAKRDAQRMATSLRTQAKFDHIMLLNTPAQTTTRSLLQALQRLNSLVKNSEDLVVVYLSSHGTVSQGRERFLVTSDTKRNVSRSGLAVKTIRLKLRKLRSRRIALILAACYTGSSESKSVRVPGTKGTLRPRQPLQTERAIQILSAASFAQPAFESTQIKGDIYTHFFLKCMRRLKHKTIIKIHVCAATRTTPFVQKWNGEVQVPKAYSELGANRDFALVTATEVQRKLGYFHTKLPQKRGMFVKLFRLGQKSRQQRKWKLFANEMTALPPGRYRILVQASNGRTVREETVVIRSGQISRFASPWSLEFQGGGLGTTGVLQNGGEFAGSGYFGLRHRYFAILLGVWGTSLTFEQDSYVQFALELRGEGGYHHQWRSFGLFVGAYISTAALWQDLNRSPHVSVLFQGGFTLNPSIRISPHWELFASLDAGVIPSVVTAQWRAAFVGALRLGFRYKLGG